MTTDFRCFRGASLPLRGPTVSDTGTLKRWLPFEVTVTVPCSVSPTLSGTEGISTRKVAPLPSDVL